MGAAALAGLVVAAVNVTASRLAGRSPGKVSTGYGLLQAGLFFFRAGVLFGAATWWWSRTHAGAEVVALLLTGAVAQLVGQVALHLRDSRE
ncbi:MAG: hypothetical protein HY554_07240 [Elusimicrobia bacterium]|nr:hypothetical protein [Elusimicrobiota bacterium]